MYHQKLIYLSTLIVVGMITAKSAIAQTNQSDTSGGQTFSNPIVHIDSKNGNGIPPTTQFDPTTGEVVGGPISTPVELSCLNNSCFSDQGNQPQEVTLNDIAEALETSLDQSLDNLATAEKNAKLANSEPRRIARRSGVSDGKTRACINPVYEARDMVEKQLVESEKFIEQVNQIEPQKNIW